MAAGQDRTGKATVLLKRVHHQDAFMGRLARGVDLLQGLEEVCLAQGITLGRVEAIGAVQMAKIGYYDQQMQEYCFFELKKGLEIISLLGNISLKDGLPVIHAHIALADAQGAVLAGHLAPGTIVYACEFVISSFSGADLVRTLDKDTALPLWDPGQG